MRIARVRSATAEHVGVVVDDRFVDLGEHFATSVEILTACADESGRARVSMLVEGRPGVGLTEVTWLPPIERPSRILCVGTNYAEHVAESDSVTEAPGHPMIFTRFPTSLVGHREAIVRPAVSERYDYEGELAVVIGATCHRADREVARSAIGGYSCFMDGTVRDYQRHTTQFTPGKNFDRSGAWGPWIVTADEVDDPYDLRLTTTVDDDVLQEASTAQLIFDLEAVVSYCSTFTTLEPGDVIATGTPGGVGYARTPPRWLRPGSTVSVAISAVGTLTNEVVDE